MLHWLIAFLIVGVVLAVIACPKFSGEPVDTRDTEFPFVTAKDLTAMAVFRNICGVCFYLGHPIIILKLIPTPHTGNQEHDKLAGVLAMGGAIFHLVC